MGTRVTTTSGDGSCCCGAPDCIICGEPAPTTICVTLNFSYIDPASCDISFLDGASQTFFWEGPPDTWHLAGAANWVNGDDNGLNVPELQCGTDIFDFFFNIRCPFASTCSSNLVLFATNDPAVSHTCNDPGEMGGLDNMVLAFDNTASGICKYAGTVTVAGGPCPVMAAGPDSEAAALFDAIDQSEAGGGRRVTVYRRKKDGGREGAGTLRPLPGPTPDGGPGTELRSLLESVGVGESDCGCRAWADWMDNLGPDGCELPRNRERIVARLRRQQKEASWGQLIRAAAHALRSGIAFRLDPTDPAPGLLDEAIRRARLRLPGSV